jgi:GNAT superfamily N-acetyltransferase
LRRAEEIKREEAQDLARVYACFFAHQQDEIAYFLRRGFRHDEGMLLLERQASADLPRVEAPPDVTIRPWKMKTEAEQQQFIEAHRRVFPRHPYSVRRLQELMAVPGWGNFTAWHGTEIAGNIMVYQKDADGHVVGCIEDLFVQRRWQKRGIAKYLLYAALDNFRKTGIHRVQLEMWSANGPALHLYRAFGFSAIDETEIAVGRYL